MSTSGIWMTKVKSMVFRWYLDDYRDSLKSAGGFWITIEIA